MPDPTGIRPTKAVVLKALADILRPVIDGLVVLELFAGTGRVSRKLLAEGAERAFAVDENFGNVDVPEGLVLVESEVMEYLNSAGPAGDIDVVFMDPPYRSNYPGRILTLLPDRRWLRKQALVAVETAAGEPQLKAEYHGKNGRGIYLVRERSYGNSRLTVYQADRRSGALEEERLS